MKSRLAPLLAGLILVTGPVAPARAHSIDDYPTSAGWKYTILSRVFYQAPDNWPRGVSISVR